MKTKSNKQTKLSKDEKGHKTHFPQIGEVEKMGGLIPLAFLLMNYNAWGF